MDREYLEKNIININKENIKGYEELVKKNEKCIEDLYNKIIRKKREIEYYQKFIKESDNYMKDIIINIMTIDLNYSDSPNKDKFNL